MARYVVEISGRLDRKIRHVLKEHAYDSVSHLVEVALENQFALEGMTLNSQGVESAASAEGGSEATEAPLQTHLAVADMPASVPCVAPPTTAQLLHAAETSEDQLYLWGQINRLFPVKLALRVLWSLSQDGPVAREELRAVAGGVARAYGLALKDYQKSRGITRAFGAWVGLPVGAHKEKSLYRYQSQFIGYRRRDGVLEGAVFRLKLAGIAGETGVQLTEAGLRWAEAANPLLDQHDYLGPPLSEAESSVYARHVAVAVPEERRPLAEVLAIVGDGSERPSEIDRKLAMAHRDWNENVVLTMRSGVLGRLWELGMLSKQGGHGVTTYRLTESGANFLETLSSSTTFVSGLDAARATAVPPHQGGSHD